MQIVTETRWEPIPGYTNYQASSAGNIKQISPNKHLVVGTNVSGHKTVSFVADTGERRRMYVHRLVLLAFHGEPHGGAFGCHYDDDPANNHLDNLRWDTPKANGADSARNNRERKTPRQTIDIHATWSARKQELAERHNEIIDTMARLHHELTNLTAEINEAE